MILALAVIGITMIAVPLCIIAPQGFYWKAWQVTSRLLVFLLGWMAVFIALTAILAAVEALARMR